MVNTHSKGLLVANSTFRNSQALFGGAIYADVGAAITLSNSSQLVHNQATIGGAIFCDNCQRLVLELQTELSFNRADTSGGAVFCDGCVLLTATDVLMTYNRSVAGSPVKAQGASNRCMHESGDDGMEEGAGGGGGQQRDLRWWWSRGKGVIWPAAFC